VFDEDYRRVINVILTDDVSEVFTVVKGMKFTQSIVDKIVYADCELSFFGRYKAWFERFWFEWI
jgi:dUTPase